MVRGGGTCILVCPPPCSHEYMESSLRSVAVRYKKHLPARMKRRRRRRRRRKRRGRRKRKRKSKWRRKRRRKKEGRRK